MGTHPIFESDFDCLTDMHRSLPRGAIKQVKPHVKGINFPSRATWTPSIPKTGPQIPAHIVALATKAPSKRELVSKVAKKKPDVATTATSATCPRGRKPRFVDIEVSDTRATRAAKLLGAKRTVPHQYTTIKINLNKANTLRVKLSEANAGPISLGDLIVRAASIALRKQGEQQISIGIKQPSDEFGFESFMLAKAAGTGVGNIGARLTSLGDATVPISVVDLQSTNVNEFTSLLSGDETSGILSLGGVTEGDLSGDTMMVTLSADGRTLQMENAMELLDHVKTLVEEPKTMFL